MLHKIQEESERSVEIAHSNELRSDWSVTTNEKCVFSSNKILIYDVLAKEIAKSKIVMSNTI